MGTRLIGLLLALALLAGGCGLRDRSGTSGTSDTSTDTTAAPAGGSDDPEARIHDRLDSAETTTPFTLIVRSTSGRELTHSSGDSSRTTVYASASTSKLVTAVVIMSLVDDGTLSLDDHPQDHLEFWPTTGTLADITLSQLLSFTSGLSDQPFCINNGRTEMSSCVEKILNDNESPTVPGSSFHYGSSHMQVAGEMAVRASGSSSWQDVFANFRSTYGLFPNSTYDLPSAQNPRLAGGMHWTADDYLEFLDALVDGRVLTSAGFEQLRADQLESATIANSPVLDARGENWHYGHGLWLECPSATFNCTDPTRLSSPGAYGAYPFIDLKNGYYGILARQGRLGTFNEGIELFETVADDLTLWASSD